MKIPFFELNRLHTPYQEELNIALCKAAESGWYVRGKCVETFEKQFAAYLGTKHVIGVGNGLDALSLIFRAYKELGKLEDGDEVLVPGNTYIASVLAITENKLVPVLVDPDLDTYNVDLQKLLQQINSKTKAIMAVNLYGQIADMEALKLICDQRHLLLVEDNAQAAGAVRNKKMSGTFSHASGFSFYPAKNLGALGDGGAVVTEDDLLAETLRSLANYGSQEKYLNQYKGMNSRLDELQAAVLSVKLAYLDDENERRRVIAHRFCDEIDNPLLALPECNGGEDHVWHLFVVRVNNRTRFVDHMTENGIQTQVHYPVSIHKQEAYKELAYMSLPITEKICDEVVSLPIGPYFTAEEVDYIIEVVNRY